jgi:ribosomal protein S18 acetylase RimI-like enzyme
MPKVVEFPMPSRQKPTPPVRPLGDGEIVVCDGTQDDFSEIIALDARVAGISRPEFWHELQVQRTASNTLILLVARYAGKIVGYAMGEVRAWPVRTPACGWVYAIGVDKKHRLRRVASALMTELIRRFQAQGVYTIRTIIDVDDHLLMSFLRSLGMTAGPFVELEMSIAQ